MDIEAAVDQIAALAREYLTGAAETYEDDEVQLGIFGIAYELKFSEGGAKVGYSCSDGREWIHAGLFRKAVELADRDETDSEPEPD